VRAAVRNYVAGRFLEVVNPRLKDSPHAQLAALLHDADVDVLEVCSATGFLGRMVAARHPGARICALDLSAELIAQGRRRAQGLDNLEFIQGDARAMPFPDSSFDVVLAAFGLSELPAAARSECLRQVMRVLRRRGRLLVVDIDDPSHCARIVHARRHLSRHGRAGDVPGAGLSRQMESHGFIVASRVNGQGRLLPFQVIVAHKP
jgi:demethylmenaquinone methyltransferase/2-methoxy-6-polyprenyl-1,4-benzoquinol methylase